MVFWIDVDGFVRVVFGMYVLDPFGSVDLVSVRMRTLCADSVQTLC